MVLHVQYWNYLAERLKNLDIIPTGSRFVPKSRLISVTLPLKDTPDSVIEQIKEIQGFSQMIPLEKDTLVVFNVKEL